MVLGFSLFFTFPVSGNDFMFWKLHRLFIPLQYCLLRINSILKSSILS